MIPLTPPPSMLRTVVKFTNLVASIDAIKQVCDCVSGGMENLMFLGYVCLYIYPKIQEFQH